MGETLSTLVSKKPDNSRVKVPMFGLDAPGKTTILYYLKVGEFFTTIPTVGFNSETVEHGGIEFEFWDIGGGDKIRPLWRHYFGDMRAIIFVIDSNDRERIFEARDEIQRLMNEDEVGLRDIPVLVFANKQDLPNAMSAEDVAVKLGLCRERRVRWTVMPSCAKTGEGLLEGLHWLSENIKNKRM